MPKMIQLRNVPDPLHRTLKVRAAQSGMTLSDYLIAEVGQLAALPTMEEMRARLAAHEPVDLGEGAAEIVREMRGT
jgi:plasmid stability protein